MENQTIAGNQNTQQIDQNQVSQPIQIPEKSRVNYWIISTIVLLVIAVSGGFYVASLKNQLNITNSSQSSKQEVTQIPTNATPTESPIPTIQPTIKFLGQNESAQQKSGFIQGTVQSEAEAYVVGENNISPVANFQLEIFDINNKLVHTTITDKDGKFTAQLPPGDYYFAYKFCSQSTDSQRVEFNIKPDQVNKKTFTLHFGPC